MNLEAIIQRFIDARDNARACAQSCQYKELANWFTTIERDLERNITALREYQSTTFPGYKIWPIVGELQNAATRASLFIENGGDDKDKVLEQIKYAKTTGQKLAHAYIASPDYAHRVLFKKCLLQATALAGLATTAQIENAAAWKEDMRRESEATIKLIDQVMEIL